MLETWDAAVSHLRTSSDIHEEQVIEVAKLLGWTQTRPASGKHISDQVQMEQAE